MEREMQSFARDLILAYVSAKTDEEVRVRATPPLLCVHLNETPSTTTSYNELIMLLNLLSNIVKA